MSGPQGSDLAGSDRTPWAFDHAGSQIVWIIRVIGTCLWALCPCAVSTVFWIFPVGRQLFLPHFLARPSSNNLLTLRKFHRCESSGRLVLWCCDTTGKLTILSTCCTRRIFMVFWASESISTALWVFWFCLCLSLGMDSSTRLLDLRSLDRRCIVWNVGTWCCGTAGKSIPRP